LFDRIIIGIGDNGEKKPFFPVERRIAWLNQIFGNEPKIRILTYNGLTIELCRSEDARYILRGLRTSADFEFERSIGQVNKLMYPEIDTVFLLSAPEYASVSSSIVRDIIRNGGDVTQFVPEGIIF
jgi:pantetheine-phosphate adenylyltransferase